MLLANIVETVSWIIAIILLYLGVSKNKYREAFVSFLFMQALTWFFGGVVVQLKLIQYPVRFFPHAFQSSFTFEYFVFPAVSVLFNLYFPKNGTKVKKLVYFLAFPTILTCAEVVLEIYTDCIEYVKWHWFFSWITMLVALYVSYKFFKWFFLKYKRMGQ